MAAWTGAGFLENYVEPGSSVVFSKWYWQSWLASRNVSGNVSGVGQVFP